MYRPISDQRRAILTKNCTFMASVVFYLANQCQSKSPGVPHSAAVIFVNTPGPKRGSDWFGKYKFSLTRTIARRIRNSEDSANYESWTKCDYGIVLYVSAVLRLIYGTEG